MMATVVALEGSGPLEARTYYVATSGNDNHTGSEAEPLRTIQKAASSARAENTILVRGDVYSETVVLHYSG